MPKTAADKPPAEQTFLARYADESARPLTSLVFVLPLLAAYEVGVLLLGPSAMRNAADVWLRQLLEWVGFGQYLLLPILTVALLLAWHHMRHDRWSVKPRVLGLMLAETVLLAILLSVIGGLQARYLLEAGGSQSSLAAVTGPLKLAVAYCGAGVYEELLFRLMLLPAVAGVARWCGAPWQTAWIIGAVLNSLLFSLAHYDLITSGGEPFAVASFVFRLLAGLFFSVLFLYRGFGIAAGSHALYDILVGVL